MNLDTLILEAAALLHWWSDHETDFATDTQIQDAADRGEAIAEQLDACLARARIVELPKDEPRSTHYTETKCPRCGWLFPSTKGYAIIDRLVKQYGGKK